MKNKIKCNFTSCWSDGNTITTPCIYYPKTGEVIPEINNGIIPTGSLEKEYITLPDKEEKLICNICHTYVLKTVINENNHDLYEDLVCSDPECEDTY